MDQATIGEKSVNRLLPVLAGVAIQLCLGTAYIWGIFQVELIARFGWSQAAAALPFSLLIFFMSVGCYLGGRFQDKFSPRPVIRIGGAVLGLGFVLASLTTAATPWWIYLTYGVIGGLGMGTTYTTTIACCQKWFPDKRGLITGCIVSALGFGGIIFTNVAAPLIRRRGVMETFVWLGLIFVIVCLAGAQFIKNPPPGYRPAGWTPQRAKARPAGLDLATAGMVRTPQFYLVTLTLMLACSAGFMVIPYAKTIGIAGGLSPEAATGGVMIISLFNSGGRLFWGWISDKLGRKRTVLILLVLAAVSIPLLMVVRSWSIFAVMALVAFAYGGFLGVFPSLTADFFGMAHAAANYGMVLLGFGFGSIIFTYVAGIFRDTGRFGAAFILASFASLVGAALFWFLKPPLPSGQPAGSLESVGEGIDR
ncbi:MAG: OFA family MFS transporter [Eubacteriales bacterium]|jgi:OFA family oxalate/formate antiporter-like MFS transporter|nr:OFA family MFS transporter [Eubacteriales bacterium]